MTVTPRRPRWTEDYLRKYFFDREISRYPRLVAKGIVCISANPGYIDPISTGGHTPRRPLPNEVKGVIGSHRTAEIPTLRRDATDERRYFLSNSYRLPYSSLSGYTVAQRYGVISLRYRRGTCPDTSPPECCDGGDGAPINAGVKTVTPRRPFGRLLFRFLNAKYLYPRFVAKGIVYISANPGYIDPVSTGRRTARRPLPNEVKGGIGIHRTAADF